MTDIMDSGGRRNTRTIPTTALPQASPPAAEPAADSGSAPGSPRRAPAAGTRRSASPAATPAANPAAATHPLRDIGRPAKRAHHAGTDTAASAPAQIGPHQMPGKVLHRIGDPSTAGGSVNAALAGSASDLPDVIGPHEQGDRLIAQCSARSFARGTADPLAVIAQAMQLPDPQKARALRGMIPAIASNHRYEQSLFPFLEPLRTAVQGVEASQARYEFTHALAKFFSEYSLERDLTRDVEHGHASQQADAFYLRFRSDCLDLLYTHATTLLPLQSAPAPAGGAAVPSVTVNPTAVAAEIDGMLASGLYLVNGAGRRMAHWHAMFADAAHAPAEIRHAALIGLAGAVRHLVGRPAQASAVEALLREVPTLAGAHLANVIGKLAQQQSPDGRHGFADGPIGGLYHRLRALSLVLEGADRREALEHLIGVIDAEPAINRPALFADMLTQVDASAPADPLCQGSCRVI